MDLTKKIKDLYIKNYKRLMKEIKEEQINVKIFFCSWIGRDDIVKMPTLPKVIYSSVQALQIANSIFQGY